ncbi:hypothetical protein HGM15179_018610 [Zosterops borbonicus]|uniref:Uncharacterized protein n=1 Tax=Zosterops borbonicus TaxID=364589 RepID=A0A8K1FVW1_9PASS|nr:hypothetical protein HGM15179_018610 [Zosterops borbonicus]
MAAPAETPVWSRSPDPTKYPLPPDPDSDSETANNQVAAFAAHDKQRVIPAQLEQHSSELHQTISKFTQLSPYHNQQEQQAAASSQIKAQKDLPSPPAPASSVSMPVLTTNPIDERQAALAKAALKDGDWKAANALSCPVLIANGQARWEPYVAATCQAMLQNRAAIDFLLLAQGHGCEEFKGMCCMNLSDHSRSIYGQLKQLKNNMGEIVVTNILFDNWISSLGFAGWIKDLIRFEILVFIVIIIMLVVVPCVLKCVQKAISHAIDSVWVVQKEKEGFVTDFLRKGGHDVYLDLLELP